MRLKSIKLAGFKSFVDPTTVSLPGNLTAVVGPNGCGKSNVIDAVRWVMGESSAKQLRGESLSDVIFNGSTARKPTTQASIELLFDNGEGRAGGQYASFNEISVRRQVSRDSQNQYFLNGARCRRRDIQDIFLGTGLGPRSYSIIEQGTISNLIEARPEDLRGYLEEAAGISQYKERRRETENRMRHTKENLERLNDLREELDKQLARLERQAKTAERYRALKAEARRLTAELQALRWRRLSGELETHNRTVEALEARFEAARAGRQQLETEIEAERGRQAAVNDEVAEAQRRYYELGAAIARSEENLRASEARVSQLETDLADAGQRRSESAHHQNVDARQIDELSERLEHIEPERDEAERLEQSAAAALEAAETAMQAWQQEWDAFNDEAAAPQRRAEVEASRIEQLEQSRARAANRLERLAEEHATADPSGHEAELKALRRQLEEIEAECEQQDEALREYDDRLADTRAQLERAEQAVADARGEIQVLSGRRASLEALQESALGHTDDALASWLEACDLTGAPRLGERVHVTAGWETAAETVLAQALRGLLVADLEGVAAELERLEEGALAVFADDGSGTRARSSPNAPDADDPQTLLARVRGPRALESLLAGVYVTDSLDEALTLRTTLDAHETVVTREGVRVSRDGLALARGDVVGRGVLQRAQELETLSEQLSRHEDTLVAHEHETTTLREALERLDGERRETAARRTELSRRHASAEAERSAGQARLEEAAARRERLEAERVELEQQQAQEGATLEAARTAKAAAEAEIERFEARREMLLERRDQLRSELDTAREAARRRRDAHYELELRRQQVETQLDSTRTARTRLDNQLLELDERLSALRASLEASREPISSLKSELDAELGRRGELETTLAEVRERLAEVEHAVRELESRRAAEEARGAEAQSELEQARVTRREIEVRRGTVVEQLAESEMQAEAVLERMDDPDTTSEDAWQQALERLEARMQRLGAINLAAIDEYQAESERKTYLDAQHADLEAALGTLEDAIAKIDRETRTRFKETFDKVDGGLRDLFPRLFGGGQAYLELSGDDLLDTGVVVMARPPGKRNSSIHLLSGGEKALTAVALVFAIFQLNPAPFCMLDEVDAPLDDANVGRFCRLVAEMSQDVQFICITHNKITMEMVEQLMGVTMQEAGVSRLVTVDVEQAAAMATG